MSKKLRIYKFIDLYIGVFICFLLFPLTLFSKIQKKIPKEVLIIRIWAIGETILTFPAIRTLKKQLPNIKITMLITKKLKEIVQMNPDIDNIIIVNHTPLGFGKILYSLIKKRYDYVIDFEPFMRISAILSFFASSNRIGFNTPNIRKLLYTERVLYNNEEHAINNFMHLINAINPINELSYESPELHITNSSKNFAGRFFNAHKIEEGNFIIGIHVGAGEGGLYRRWTIERFAELTKQLITKQKAKILLLGSKEEIQLIQNLMNLVKNKESVFLTITENISDLASILKKCQLYIGNDTGPLHLAAVLGIPTIGLFGPETPKKYGPIGKNAVAIYKDNICPFSPCIIGYINRIPYKCINNKNPQICLLSITVDDILKKIDSVIQTQIK